MWGFSIPAMLVMGSLVINVVVFGVMSASKSIAVRRASVEAATREAEAQVQACSARVIAIEKDLNDKASAAIRAAEEAEISVAPTPVEKAELEDLCNRSVSCRERKRGKK